MRTARLPENGPLGRWLSDVERAALADNWAKRIEAVPGWGAKVWFKGTVCRIYVERSGQKCGYLTLFENGNVRKSLDGDDSWHRELDHLFVPDLPTT